jgi:Zn-dependent peptidase ImmA (M78 family)
VLPEIPDEQFAQVLDACAAEILWEAGIEHPPVSAFVLAERLGMVVARDDAMLHRARFVRLEDDQSAGAPQPTILLAPEPRIERNHWAVAHEIGESMAHRVFDALSVRADAAPPLAREIVANQLANRLLLPTHWFEADGRDCDWDLLELKSRFESASHELIARRMLDMRTPIIVTLCDLGRVKWRRSNQLGRVPRLSPVEEELWHDCHETGEATESDIDASRDGLARVRCWPIHEPDWRREILRTEIDAWW